MASFVDLRCHHLDHEPCAGFPVETVLDPYPTAVHPHVFVDQRQAEPGTLAAGASAGATLHVTLLLTRGRARKLGLPITG